MQPLPINLAVHSKNNERDKESLNIFNGNMIKLSITKEKLSEKQRAVRRMLMRRHKRATEQEKLEDEEEEKEGMQEEKKKWNCARGFQDEREGDA